MGKKLDRDAKFYGLSNNTQGDYSERVMWQKFVQFRCYAHDWDKGSVIIQEGEFLNRYEREKDDSWSQTMTIPVPEHRRVHKHKK